MLDLIMLGLLSGTLFLFVAHTLDEITRRMEIRRSNLTSPVQPNEAPNQWTIESVAEDDEKKRAA